MKYMLPYISNDHGCFRNVFLIIKEALLDAVRDKTLENIDAVKASSSF